MQRTLNMMTGTYFTHIDFLQNKSKNSVCNTLFIRHTILKNKTVTPLLYTKKQMGRKNT